VKEEDGAAVGCVYVEPRGERAYLGLLSIVPARQGAGLGKQLNAAAENFARQQGCKWMDLRLVSPRADILLPVYRRMGYAETGTQEYPAVLVEKMTLPGHFILMAKAL
jgi:GNAT superfamily N-acetyltransferase